MKNYDASQPGLYKTAFEQRIVFLLVFAGVFALTYGFFFSIDFLPEKPTESTRMNSTLATGTTEKIIDDAMLQKAPVEPLPVSIIFDTLGSKEIPILNPESRSVSALDTALLSGVVRHPDSATFAEEGTIFLFGHSSYLPNVINKNFQAFNGIQKLVWGDIVRLRSKDVEYVYRVDRVYEESATNGEVNIEYGKPKLTLVTCDSFGSKDDRFVVEATLVETHPLGVGNSAGNS